MIGLGARSLPRRTTYYALVATLILGCCLVVFRPDRSLGPLAIYRTADCTSLRGLDDIFIIVKTGSCEVHAKLPVHLHTTLQCPTSWAVLSDVNETVKGIPVYDSFADGVREEFLNEVDEFELYKKLKQAGTCDKLAPEDLKAADTTPGNNGNFKSRGWNLDKWKFLPMVSSAWHMRPNATWYFIIETDTLVVWPNLLRWIELFDASKAHYIGSQMQIGEQLFSYGGGGTLVSNSAMRKYVQHYEANRTSLEDFTRTHWAGDCVFGKALQDVGVRLMWSWPYLLTESLGGLDYGAQNYGMRLWCSPVMTYHHMNSEATLDFWRFQEEWYTENPTGVLRHKDVFINYVMPRIASPKDRWDNLSTDKVTKNPLPTNAEECLQACTTQHGCVQYSFGPEGCRTSKTIRLGQPVEKLAENVHSGWITDRMQQFVKGIRRCSDHQERFKKDFQGAAS